MVRVIQPAQANFQRIFCSTGCGVDNDDGITVIDITEPASPKCCFLFPDTPPLDGPGYLEHYDDDLQQSPDVLGPIYTRAAKDLEHVPLVSLDALAEAWPLSYGHHRKGTKRKLDHGSRISGETEKKRRLSSEEIGESDEAVGLSQIVRGNERPEVLSLASMALREAVSHGLKTGDTRLIEESLWLPGRVDIIRQLVYDHVQAEDSALSLLKKLVEYDIEHAHGAVDFAGIQLSDHRLAAVICGQHNLSSLNVSRNSLVTAAAVEQILATVPNLKRLMLIDCPAVTTEDLRALHAGKPHLFRNLEAFVHPFFQALSHLNLGDTIFGN